MSYEGKMLSDLKMPTRQEVELALLKTLFKHNGVVKEFNSNEEIVNELAIEFNLNEEQRNAVLERIYHKENRIVKSPLWHRLLFRAADNLAKLDYITKPSATFQLTNKKEWMLTEFGYDKVLEILKIPIVEKENLKVISYEVQTIAKKLKEQVRPEVYNPFDDNKTTSTVTKDIKLRNRGFRQAIIEAYDFRCAVCGLKISSPLNLQWEVEAAHIVPHSSNGRDDIWNGLALCRLHHWAFDVGWFSLKENFEIVASKLISKLPDDMGKIGNYDFMRNLLLDGSKINLPIQKEIYPHKNSIEWHRQNIFINS